jgi:hypothetical protein
VSTRKIKGPTFFDTTNSDRYVKLILMPLFGGLISWETGKPTYFARTGSQYSKRNSQYFKKRALSWVKKYFQKLQAVFRSWWSALRLLYEIRWVDLHGKYGIEIAEGGRFPTPCCYLGKLRAETRDEWDALYSYSGMVTRAGCVALMGKIRNTH